jgi:hypothetical protein
MSNEYPPPPPPPGDDQSGAQGGGWGTPPPPPPASPGGPPPPGYGQPYPQGYGQQPPKNSAMAITSLVLGILGIPCCGCGVFSIAALVLGILGKKEIAESNGAKTGAGLAQAGFILGIIGIVFSVLYWILLASGALDVNTYSDFN